jgi:hypothetical protein
MQLWETKAEIKTVTIVLFYTVTVEGIVWLLYRMGRGNCAVHYTGVQDVLLFFMVKFAMIS